MRLLRVPLLPDIPEAAWLSDPVSFLAIPSLHFCDALLRSFNKEVHAFWAVELGMGGSAFAVATSVANFWQLAVTAEGLREDTAAGSAVPSALTSALNAVTTALLFAPHFTVPVTLLAIDVAVDARLVVVVELLVEVEHPVITTAVTMTASTAMRFILLDLSSGQSTGTPRQDRPRVPSSVRRGGAGVLTRHQCQP